jgi:hypothetical protein
MRVREKYMPVSVRDRERATFKPTGCGREGHVGNHGDAGTSWCETCRAIEAEKRAEKAEAALAAVTKERDEAVAHAKKAESRLKEFTRAADEISCLLTLLLNDHDTFYWEHKGIEAFLAALDAAKEEGK